MHLTANAIRLLAEKGLSAADIAELAEELERSNPGVRTANAERQAAYRARLRETGMSAKQWRARSNEVIAQSDGSCAYCGADDRVLVCDHIQPLIKGGSSDWGNLVAACNECNSGKSGKTLEEWMGVERAGEWKSTRVMQRVTTQKEVSPTPPSRKIPLKGEYITTHTRKADAEPEGFEAFWSVYPRRVGKGEARKAYCRAIRRTSLTDLITAVRRDAESQWRDRPPDMIPHPSTWLNQARWEDEPPPETPHSPRPTHERRHDNPGLDRSSSNLERAFAGAEVAARIRAEQSSSGF